MEKRRKRENRRIQEKFLVLMMMSHAKKAKKWILFIFFFSGGERTEEDLRAQTPFALSHAQKPATHARVLSAPRRVCTRVALWITTFDPLFPLAPKERRG